MRVIRAINKFNYGSDLPLTHKEIAFFKCLLRDNGFQVESVYDRSILEHPRLPSFLRKVALKLRTIFNICLLPSHITLVASRNL